MFKLSLRAHRGSFQLAVGFQASTPGVTALFGRSGCGKSTTINLIAGLLRPDEGRIEIDGDVLFDSAAGIDVPAERRRIGCVFQDSRLFPHLDVVANLRYGLKRAGRGAKAGAGATSAAPPIRFDDAVALLGLQSLLTRRPAQLSGGERQRVAIGRALLSQPRLLLLDEPLSSLDIARRGELLPWLERLRDELALPMVYVSHQFEEVLRLADAVVLMEHGAVVGSGPVAAMSRAPALRAVLGDDALNSVLEGVVESVDAGAGMARVRVGDDRLSVRSGQLAPGQAVQVQVSVRAVSTPPGPRDD